MKGPKPKLVIGNFGPIFMGKLSIADYVNQLYRAFSSEPFVGIFVRATPTLILKDLDLIKNVLIKDFSVFAERDMKIHEKVCSFLSDKNFSQIISLCFQIEPLSLHLVALDAKRWRPLRTRLSPVFTSGKIKEMFYLILKSGDAYEKYLDTVSLRNEPINIRELTDKYTTDVIGSCAFGLETNAICDEVSEFQKMGQGIFQMDLRNFLRYVIRDMSDFLYLIIGPLLIRRDIEDFFINTVRQTMEQRRLSKIARHDFIDVLIDFQDHPEKLPGIGNFVFFF